MSAPRSLARLVLAALFPLAAALIAGCASLPTQDELCLSAGLSALPNFGLTAGAGQLVAADEEKTWTAEAVATFQFLDDEDLANDGYPAAGDWTQVQLGVKRLTDPGARRHWTARAGLVWFRALGDPNIVQERGDYEGLYGGLGFETSLSESFSMGPDFVLMLAHRESGQGVVLVPQLAWRVLWSF